MAHVGPIQLFRSVVRCQLAESALLPPNLAVVAATFTALHSTADPVQYLAGGSRHVSALPALWGRPRRCPGRRTGFLGERNAAVGHRDTGRFDPLWLAALDAARGGHRLVQEDCSLDRLRSAGVRLAACVGELAVG